MINIKRDDLTVKRTVNGTIEPGSFPDLIVSYARVEKASMAPIAIRVEYVRPGGTGAWKATDVYVSGLLRKSDGTVGLREHIHEYDGFGADLRSRHQSDNPPPVAWIAEFVKENTPADTVGRTTEGEVTLLLTVHEMMRAATGNPIRGYTATGETAMLRLPTPEEMTALIEQARAETQALISEPLLPPMPTPERIAELCAPLR